MNEREKGEPMELSPIDVLLDHLEVLHDYVLSDEDLNGVELYALQQLHGELHRRGRKPTVLSI